MMKHIMQSDSWEGSIDIMTGLPNMTMFRKLFSRELKQLLSEGEQPAISYFNVNNLKSINENFGFVEGDEVLRTVADTLRSSFRGRLVSRFAEDHFVVLSEHSGLIEKLHTIKGLLRRSRKEGLSINAGVYIYDREDQEKELDVSIACDRAKLACDSIKTDYSTTVRIYDTELKQQADNRNYILDHFQEALEQGYIRPCFQPIVDIGSCKVTGLEALCRWEDPVRGSISPGIFIPILEEYRLIHRLDFAALEMVLKEISSMQERGQELLPISLNISKLDFELCDSLHTRVTELLGMYGIERRLIHIEITESTLSNNTEFIKQEIKRLRSSGFEIWIDDFGSGYSSLNILGDFHFEAVKLDMAFLRDFGKRKKTMVILGNLVPLIQALGMRTVVEGVENEEQLLFLKEIGCDYAQGFLFSPAVTVDRLPETIAAVKKRCIQIFERAEL